MEFSPRPRLKPQLSQIMTGRSRTGSNSGRKKVLKKIRMRGRLQEDSVEQDPYSLHLSKGMLSSTKLRISPLEINLKKYEPASTSRSLRKSQQQLPPLNKMASQPDKYAQISAVPIIQLQEKRGKANPSSQRLLKKPSLKLNGALQSGIKQKQILVQRKPNAKISQEKRAEHDVVKTSVQLDRLDSCKKNSKRKKKVRRPNCGLQEGKTHVNEFRKLAQSLTDKEAKRLEKIFLIEYAAKNARLLKDSPSSQRRHDFKL